MVTFLFVLSIFVSVWFGSINIARMIQKIGIPTWNFVIMSIAITGVITHLSGVW